MFSNIKNLELIYGRTLESKDPTDKFHNFTNKIAVLRFNTIP